PTYEVNASLIVKPINTAQALDIQNNLFQAKNTNLDIEKDIQIMRSNVIIDRVIDSLNLEVAYCLSGKILNEELYKSSPFIVKATMKQDAFYDYPVRLKIISSTQYQLDYSSVGKEQWGTYDFGRHYTTPVLDFTITRNPHKQIAKAP